MRPRPSLTRLGVVVVLSVLVALALMVDRIQADGCSFVGRDFACSAEHAYSVMAASGCQCFRCTERDGSGSYACQDAPACGADYTTEGSDHDATDNDDAPTWSSGAYFAIGAVFIAASLVLYAVLYAITRCQSVRKYVAEKPATASDTTSRRPSVWVRSYRFVYAKVFGSLLTQDGKRTRRLTEYWVTECQLLDCFWCCSAARSERPRRKVSLRLMRLASSLLVTASISFFFGTLEFDTTTCTTYANISLCSSSSSSSLGRSLAEGALVPDRFTSSTTSSSTTTTTSGGSSTTTTTTTSGGGTSTTTSGGNGGASTTTTSGDGGSSTTTTTTGGSSHTSVSHTIETSNSCSTLPPIIGSLSKASSIIAFCVTQCVKFVGSYAQNLGKPGSTLDWGAHLLWLLVAAGAIPVSAVLSTRLLSHGAYTYKSEQLRMRLILSVTLSTWLQVQVADIFKVPVFYLAKKFGRAMLPSPESAVRVVQPRRRELDCLGGQHEHEPMGEEDEQPSSKVDAVTLPRSTRQ